MSIFLGGGGSVRQEDAVWREAFDGVGSVLYWPLALPRHQHPDGAHLKVPRPAH